MPAAPWGWAHIVWWLPLAWMAFEWTGQVLLALVLMAVCPLQAWWHLALIPTVAAVEGEPFLFCLGASQNQLVGHRGFPWA